MEKGQSCMEVLTWVRDVYRNCFRILSCCDPILESYELQRYTWAHIYDLEPLHNEWRSTKIEALKNADALLCSYIFRQYYSRDYKDREIVTVGVAPWRKVRPETFTPACYISRFMAQSPENAIYWIGAMPIWEETNSTDGTIREFTSVSGLLHDDMRKQFDEIVSKEKRMIGTAVPLFDITSSTELESRLIKPFLQYQW